MKKYNEGLVKQVREGKLAVHNINCTKEELINLIRYIFPEDHDASGDSVFYYCSNKNRWQPLNYQPNLPYKSVKEFLEEEFVLPEKWYIKVTKENKETLGKWRKRGTCGVMSMDNTNIKGYITYQEGYWTNSLPEYPEITFDQFCKYVLKKENNMKEKEIIRYKLIKPEYEKAVDDIINANIGYFNDKSLNIKECPISIEKLRKAGVLDIWFEPVYKEEKKLPKINGYEGKISGNQIIYGNSCAIFTSKFFQDLKKLDEENKFSGSTRRIKSITLNTGVEITIEQIQEIVEFLKTKN